MNPHLVTTSFKCSGDTLKCIHGEAEKNGRPILGENIGYVEILVKVGVIEVWEYRGNKREILRNTNLIVLLYAIYIKITIDFF